jgi:hypothetical protein
MPKWRQGRRSTPCSLRRIEFLSRIYAPAGSRHLGPSFLKVFTHKPTGCATKTSPVYGTSRERSASAEARESSHWAVLETLWLETELSILEEGGPTVGATDESRPVIGGLICGSYERAGATVVIYSNPAARSRRLQRPISHPRRRA